jgi:hypothetical protein
MIDSLGPSPTNPEKSSQPSTEDASEFETQGSRSPIRPKVRYTNYDSPEASIRTEAPPQPASNQATAVLQPAPTSKPRPAPASQVPLNALARSKANAQKSSGFDRVIGIAKTVLPLVGKMLPLLEGNVVSAASNLLLNKPVQEVDLRPLEDSIARLQADQRALTFHTSEQKSALHRLEDEFAGVQEAVHKNAADQAELIESVARLAKRTSSFMRLVVVLLVASILFTALLCVRIAYIIRF